MWPLIALDEDRLLAPQIEPVRPMVVLLAVVLRSVAQGSGRSGIL